MGAVTQLTHQRCCYQDLPPPVADSFGRCLGVVSMSPSVFALQWAVHAVVRRAWRRRLGCIEAGIVATAAPWESQTLPALSVKTMKVARRRWPLVIAMHGAGGMYK